MKALTILVAEDDALQALMLGDILEEMGHKVCAVTSTVSGALAAIASYQPTLLIVDAWLKDGSGLTLIDKVSEKGHVPHLFATGDVAKIKLARPNSVVIQKPYQVFELEAAIERAIAVVPTTASQN